MMPPIVRRCPECGHVGWSHRFAAVVTDTGRQLVERPSCGQRFRPIDDPRLA